MNTYKRIVRKQGVNSNIIVLPIEICRNMNIKTNTVLNIEQKDNEIILRPVLERIKQC